jgi:hypothetical protein
MAAKSNFDRPSSRAVHPGRPAAIPAHTSVLAIAIFNLEAEGM